MTEYTVDSYPERQASIDAATAVFLASGGVIAVLPGPGWKERTARHSTQCNSRPAKRRTKETTQPRPTESQKTLTGWKGNPQMVARLRELSSTMHYRQAADAVGISESTARLIARTLGFKFAAMEFEQTHSNGVLIDPEKDAAMVERITALRDIGLSRNKAQAHLGISNTLFNRLMAEYQIHFPKSKPGPDRSKKSV